MSDTTTIMIGDESDNMQRPGLQWLLNMVSGMIGQVRFDYQAIKAAAARAVVAEVKRQAALTSTPVDDFIASLLEAFIGELLTASSEEGVESAATFDGMTSQVWSGMSRAERREWIKNFFAKAGRQAPEESSPVGSIFWNLVLSLGFALVKIILERWLSR